MIVAVFVLIFSLLILASFVSADVAPALRVSGVGAPDVVYLSDPFEVHVALDAETLDWQTIASLPELGIVAYGLFESSAQNSRAFLFVPQDVPSGEYLVRVQLRQGGADEEQRSQFRHRWITIVG